MNVSFKKKVNLDHLYFLCTSLFFSVQTYCERRKVWFQEIKLKNAKSFGKHVSVLHKTNKYCDCTKKYRLRYKREIYFHFSCF